MTRRIWLALVPALAYAQAPDDETVWREFVQWLPSGPPSENPASLLEAYRASVLAQGANAAEAERRLNIVRQFMRTRSDGWRQIFNRIYSSARPGFSTQPNALLISTVEGRTPGRALDVGMGQGRNSVFLALKGWDVTGFDVSDGGLAVARQNAAQAGVKINAVLQGNEQFDYGTAQWDLIVITYEPFPVTSEAYVRRLFNALRPGGLLVIESFASDRTAQARKPVDIDPAELLRAMLAFQILHFQDVEAVPDWDPAKTRLARLVAQKITLR